LLGIAIHRDLIARSDHNGASGSKANIPGTADKSTRLENAPVSESN